MKFERIVFTGVPGTGKTTISKEVGERIGLAVTNVNTKFLGNHNLANKNSEGEEVSVDLKKLRKTLLEKKGILESHLLCEFSLPGSLVIVLRCDPHVLEERLNERNYSKEKVRENLECEALDYCTQLAEDNYEEVYELDTSKRPITDSVEECIKIVQGKGRGDTGIDYSEFLME